LLGATSRDPSGPELVFWHELLHIRSRPTTTSPTVRLAALVTVTCNSHLTSHSRLQLIETAADTMSDGTRRRQTWSVEDWPGPSSVLANISGDERGCHARMGPRGDAEHDGVGSDERRGCVLEKGQALGCMGDAMTWRDDLRAHSATR
jgi:hypothetical protein